MATSYWHALRVALWSRHSLRQTTIRRRHLRLMLESLEPRQLLDASPHGGAGTLFDEHEAVMRLIDFHEIHEVDAGGATTNYYYVARDGDSNPATPNYWSDLSNWVKETFDATASPPAFVESPADHLPATGDDVEIPSGVTMDYDLGPGPFAMPTAGGAGVSVSVKNDLRLHSVGVGGGLNFKSNTDLVMYFETMVVEASGSLSINEDPGHTARLVIAASDWTKFSLANPFDTSLDPFQFARGMISHGTVNMTGENVTPFVTLPQLTRAGNNVVPPKPPTVKGVAPVVSTDPGSFKFTIPAGTATAGWTVGDRIVVTGTDPNKVNPVTGASSDEEALITAVTPNADGSTMFTAQVQIAVTNTTDPKAPPTAMKTLGVLQYDHAPPLDPSTGKPYAGADGKPLFGVQIANLSRNITIQSEDPYHTAARGHTMFMHSANVNIAGVGFLGLGRSDKRTVVDDVQLYTKEIIDALNQAASLQTPPGPTLSYELIGQFLPGTGINPRGRYSVHFHRAGINETDGTDPNNPILKAATPAEVQDSVVVDGPGWGYVSHTSYVNFDNNVAFNVIGASFVTEAGNEMGRFTGNLAIKGVGANNGEGIESREMKQDFGFQGDGFWFQGAAIAVENNIAVSQRHDGFVFFTVPLEQNYSWVKAGSDPANPTIVTARQEARITTTMMAKVYDAALISALGGEGVSVDPGNIPILSFKNNTALADGTGMETWFHQLGSKYARELGSQIVGLKVAATRGTAMFDPYTNITTVKDTVLIGNPTRPGGVGMNRNDVTANFTYENVTIRGFDLGIAIPVNGLDVVTGGTYQNKRNFEVTTANSSTRTVMFSDGAASLLTFLPLPTATDETGRINVDLRTSYNPKDRDLSKMFNPDIIRMGTVWLNSFALNGGAGTKQLYYYQQNSAFKPFPANDEKGNPINYGGPVTDAFGNLVDYTGVEIPPELFDKSNADLMASYGLAIGGTVAPAGAQDGRGSYTFTNSDGTTGTASPRINGLIGELSTYQLSLDTTSGRYTKNTDPTGASPAYAFSYRYAKPTADGTTTVNVSVKIGNFVPASGFAVQLTTLQVNGVPVTIPAPTPPLKPTPAVATPLIVASAGTKLTLAQVAANAATTKANKAATDKYNADLKAYNNYWTTYYGTPVKLSLREGWNVVTGDLDGTGKMRSQLIYGDTIQPELNLTTPDKNQLRRLTTGSDPWAAGKWDQTAQAMSGVSLGSTDATPKTTTVNGQFVAVMHPDDLSFGFGMKGQIVDNSFGHKSFEVFIGNLKPYLGPGGVPLLTPPTDGSGAALANYANIQSYQALKSDTPGAALAQRLQTIFFAVKDSAGNSKTFALTIYLDSTAPRTGGSASPSGSVTPSASMVSLANQLYIIDLETFLLIDGTKKK